MTAAFVSLRRKVAVRYCDVVVLAHTVEFAGKSGPRELNYELIFTPIL